MAHFELADPRKTSQYWASKICQILKDAADGNVQTICFPSLEDVEKFELTFFTDLFHVVIPTEDNGPIMVVPKYGLLGDLVPLEFGKHEE